MASSELKGPPLGMFHLLMHIGHLLEEHCRSGLAEFGLHHGQARVLMALEREGELIQARLAGGLGIAPPTLSIMLKKLLEQGLVKRAADAADVRAYRISLTPKGRQAVKRVQEVWGQAYETIIESLDGDNKEFVRSRLLKIRNALGGTSPEL
jgi:DNA-binding MarR family transcriptional regulator